MCLVHWLLPFHPHSVWSLPVMAVSWRQQVFASYWLIQSADLHLLLGELRPSMFRGCYWQSFGQSCFCVGCIRLDTICSLTSLFMCNFFIPYYSGHDDFILFFIYSSIIMKCCSGLVWCCLYSNAIYWLFKMLSLLPLTQGDRMWTFCPI